MKSSKMMGILIFLMFTVFLVSAGYAKGPAAKPFIPDLPAEWAAVYPGDLYPEFEYNGLTPACSNAAGTESDEFFFFVKSGTVNNLVVYFQGGGACWDPITCLSVKPFAPDVTEADNPANYGGMFDFQNPDNPFRDWSFVFIPYCTGDIHWGANDKTYSGVVSVDGQPVFVEQTIQHRGFVNFQVVLQFITEQFQKPHKIFVTGSSAGAYGAIGGFPWLKNAYPKAKVTLLGDAGMGVNPPEFTQLSRSNWNIQLPPWIFELSGDYPSTEEIWSRIADYYPHSKMGEFTNAWDSTQIWFYGFMFVTLGLPSPPNVALDWHLKMWEGLDFKSGSPNYRYYVADGTAHTILAGNGFYEEDTADGVLFLDWLGAMIRNQGGTNGHGAMPWENIACEGCRGMPVMAAQE